MANFKNSILIKQLKDVSETLCNKEIMEWKEYGGKVVGYLYSYIPDEILTASEILSFQIRGTGSLGTELSDTRLSSINCSFVRNCLYLALRGDMDFLDGIIAFDECDNIQCLYENWLAKAKPDFSHFVVLPKKRGVEQLKLYRKELAILIAQLEDHFGIDISDYKLREAIHIHNNTRYLQRRLVDLCKKKKPPLTGSETQAILVAGTAMSKIKYNKMLNQLLDEIGESEGEAEPKSRIMIIGEELDYPGLFEAIESQGVQIVAATMIMGRKHLWEHIDEDTVPLDAIASYYLNKRILCPRIYGSGDERMAWHMKMSRDFSVDGIISIRIPFCDRWGFEQEGIKQYFKNTNIPTLSLDLEYILNDSGEIQTQIQSFMTTIEERKL